MAYPFFIENDCAPKGRSRGIILATGRKFAMDETWGVIKWTADDDPVGVKKL